MLQQLRGMLFGSVTITGKTQTPETGVRMIIEDLPWGPFVTI